MDKEIESALGKAYENFLMRDITYLFAGIIILMSVKYAYKIDIFNYYLSGNALFNIILFLIISYFIGLITKEALVFKDANYKKRWYWYNTPTPNIGSYGKSGYLSLIHKIQKEYGSETLRRLERVAYFFHISASIGIASFISFVLLLSSLLSIGIASFISFVLLLPSLIFKNFFPFIEFELKCSLITIELPCETIIVTLIMLFVFVISIIQNQKKLEDYHNFLNYLNNEMEGYYNIP